MPVSSVVIDASKANEQKEFINNLHKDRAEVILDTKRAELSSIGRFEGLLKTHIAHQAHRSLEMLNEVPNLQRAAHFLDNEMTSAIRKAQKIRSLRTGNESLDRRLVKAGDRIDSLARNCENLLDQQNGGAQVQPTVRRGKYQGDS